MFRKNLFLSKIILLNMALGCFFLTAVAQSGNQFFISLETQHTAMALQVDSQKEVSIVYFGKKLDNPQEYSYISQAYHQGVDYSGELNSAYTPAGSRNLLEPAIEVTHSDGNKSLDLKYVTHHLVTIDANVKVLEIELKDPVYALQVKLFYKIYYQEDVIEQWTEITNDEKGNVVLQKFASANLYLKAPSFWLRQYHGDWVKEMQPEESQLTHGIKTLDSKLGTRAELYQPSTFMISFGKPATEDEGDVLYGAMEWSSNFRIDLELDPLNNLRVIAGMNNYASPYNLKSGENFTTPPFLYTLSDKGKGAASRQLQSWARHYKILNGQRDRLTLLNNWESTGFDFNEDRLKALLKDTKKLGVDMFLLDDGWFGNKYPRNSDHAGLGDWQENVKKLPNGLVTLVKEARNDGVKFGIWLEPEMVSPKSELYNKHPDWVIKQPKREEHYFRNQLVLDLSNPRVQDFVYQIVDSLFIKNPDLAYIKWDCNAVIFNANSSYLKNQSNFYVDYGRGLYKVLARIRAKYPHVPMMLCAGGGGRVDYGALQYFTEFWPSDNTDPLERIFMQWEYSYFYPAIASANHVTNWGKQPLKFKVDVAMMGKLGFDIDISKLNQTDLLFCQQAIKNYDYLKPVILQGSQYRLSDPNTEDVAAIMYLNQERSAGVIFNYLVNYRYDHGSKSPIRLKGLDPAKQYRLKEINLYPGQSSGINNSNVFSGDYLMKIGFNPNVTDNASSVVIQLDEL